MYQTLSQIEAARDRQRTQPTYRELCTEYAGDMSTDIEQAMAPGRRLPIDPPNLRGNMPRNERKPVTPQVVPGVLPRELRIDRAYHSRLETVAQAVYPTLTHEARVLLRLLDHARDQQHHTENMWAVRWPDLMEAFTVNGGESWEPHAALWKAVDELIEAQVACIIPGASWGDQMLFVAEHGHRSMLRSRVLHNADEIPLFELSVSLVAAACNSLEQPKAA